MLVHLKPRRSLRKNQIMQNYVQTANWTYNNSNAIHCQKKIKSSKIEKILTDRVSANGKSLSPSHSNQETLDFQMKEDAYQADRRLTQIFDSQKAKVQSLKRNAVVQLSTLYKKTFKYNTTMHQILKNLTKNVDSKTKKVKESQQIQQVQEKDKKVAKYYIKQMMWGGNSEEKHKNHYKLQMLQNIKKQCSLLQIDDRGRGYKVNQINLNVNNDQKMIKTTFLQWRVNKPNHTKLSWRKEPRHKSTFKSNSILSPKFNYKTVESQSKDDTFPLRQGQIDSLFQSYDTYQTYKSKQQKLISPRMTEPLEKISQQTLQKVPNSERKTKFTIQTSPNYRIIKNKQYSYRIGNVHNTQFPVDAWKTKEREWEEFNSGFS